MDTVLSHVRGSTEPPLRRDTIGGALENAAALWGGREAIVSVHQNVRWTYAELNARASALAAALISLNLKPGARVGIWSPNNAEWALTQFATAKAGLILVNINPAYRISELEFTLNKVGVEVIICPERFKTSAYAEMIDALVEDNKVPFLARRILIGGRREDWIGFDQLSERAGIVGVRQADVEARAAAVQPEDAVNIQFTSGTTGLPKGATLSHLNILNNGFFVGEAIGLKPADRLCIPVPLYHCFGMVMGNLGCVTHGATMVYPAESFDPLAVLQAIESEGCTGLYGVPTMFIAMLQHEHFGSFDLSSLRIGCMAGSPCPSEVMRQVIDQMHMRDITIAYGMTETSPVSFQSSVVDSLECRVTTIGRVLPHLECKVIDSEGRTVPRGQPGELCTRGYAVMLGYWNDAERTAETVDAEGWMHTGDLATIDADGYGNIVGRLKDMIIRGGENVYPREIEEFLYRHPKLADVAVVGVPDERYGEEICAWIKLKPGEVATEEEIRGFCHGQIAHYKVPRYVRFVTDYPMTVTGKIQKFQIRQAMKAELGVAEAKTA